RRIRESMLAGRISSISRFQDRLLHQPAFLERFLRGFSSTGLSMFSEPCFYRAFRMRVVPQLRTYPFIRIWHAGCSTGEGVYSMAILLTEEDLYDRCRIYATDMNDYVLTQAMQGIFPIKQMQDYTENYINAGGKLSFSEYY